MNENASVQISAHDMTVFSNKLDDLVYKLSTFCL